jgi:hypothetical protein
LHALSHGDTLATMIEPDPWRGSLYGDGINGCRIAIIGYSHHGDFAEVQNSTIDTVKQWLQFRNFRNSFFPYIEGYFDEGRDIWNHVMFFNYLPLPFTSSSKFDSGSDNQIKDAQSRFLRIMQEDDWPCKAIVFTSKGWASISQGTGEIKRPLDPERFPGFSWVNYDANGHTVSTFGLRHPQGAKRELMRSAVQHILGLPCVGP